MHSENKSNLSTLQILKTVFRKLGSLILTLLMVGIITGCLVAAALTVFILQSIGDETPITLDSIEQGYTSVIYAKDETDTFVEIKQLYIPNNNRIPVTLDEISPHVVDAVIAIEDKRFEEHDGVDWVRTTGSFINMFIPLYDSMAGGSTIHQQLIKNITGDNEPRIDRKVQEIFRALNLAQNYSKDQVMEAYLNVVPFGAGANGIETAANTYFGKSAKDLTIAESAAIVGITKFPTAYNPFFYPDENKKRQEDVLFYMNKHGRISDEDYEAALVEPLVFQSSEQQENVLEPNSYYEDYVIDSVIEAIMTQKSLSRPEAANDLYMSGYKIYTPLDMKAQERLEEFYLSEANFPPIARDEYPQSAAIITTLDGAIVAMVGGTGPKTESRSFNRATMAKRQPGSTFKPIGAYALAFEYDLITPSTIISDTPINPDAPQNEWYPKNYYGKYRGPVTVESALRDSINTVAVKVTQMVSPETVFEFLRYDLEMTSLIDPTDIDIAPMALGGVTEGVTPLELVGAYQMIANGGYYTKPYAFTHITDVNDRTVLVANTTPRQVIQEDTSILLSKMTQEVVRTGTGTAAQIPDMPTAGKTGTSNEDVDQWFVGFTPYYVANVWLGYDQPWTYNKYGDYVRNSVLYSPNPYPTPSLFRKVMEPLHEDLPPIPFLESDEVVQKVYCTVTGNQATTICPSTATTWYKTSNIPPLCDAQHVLEAPPDGEGGDDAGSTPTSGDGSGVTSILRSEREAAEASDSVLQSPTTLDRPPESPEDD